MDVRTIRTIIIAQECTALDMVGKGKLFGLDEIPIEVLQYLAYICICRLMDLFNIIFRTAKIPSEW